MVNGPGLANDDQGYVCTTSPGADVVGTHSLHWVIFSSTNGLIANFTLSGSQLTSSTGSISLANNSLSTTGAVTAASQTLGTLALAPGSISDATGTINFGSAALKSGTLQVGGGQLTDTSGTISCGSTNVTTTGSVSARNLLVLPTNASRTRWWI